MHANFSYFQSYLVYLFDHFQFIWTSCHKLEDFCREEVWIFLYFQYIWTKNKILLIFRLFFRGRFISTNLELINHQNCWTKNSFFWNTIWQKYYPIEIILSKKRERNYRKGRTAMFAYRTMSFWGNLAISWIGRS